MSDPIPKDGGTEAGGSDENAAESLPGRLPPKDLPEELVRRRLARLDTRRALAELCKTLPGLEEVLLPRGIQARSEEHTSELQSRQYLVCRLLLEKKKH